MATRKRDHLREIEERVQKQWAEQGTYERDAPDEAKEKVLVTFPYPYMNGRLHLGHAYSFTKAEFATRFQGMLGKEALLPFGFHCTGMPISAAAKKLNKEFEEVDEEEGEEAAAPEAAAEGKAEDKSMYGQFKGKKSKAVAKSGGMAQSDILRAMGISDDDIAKFRDPMHWLRYFVPYGYLDLQRFGSCIDWRRSFITTDLNPFYDQFIRWQFRKLKEGGYVKFGKRPTVWAIGDGQPCADHDRSEGEGVGPQEYTLIKMKVKTLPEEWKEKAGDQTVFLVAATLRPETMYGQTNCFVLPEGEYGLFQMKNNEIFVCAERSALNMCYQDTGDLGEDKKPQKLLTVMGKDLIGLPLSAPLATYDTVYVLPMLTISMTKGTGVVTSVPADSPDDFACLRDWQTRANWREQYGVKEEWCNADWCKIVDIIEIPTEPEFGTAAAPVVVEKLKIQSHKDKDKLAEAKKVVYLKGFTEGVMLVGDYKGKPVKEAKPLVKKDLIAQGLACTYYEPEGRVVSRGGEECIVAFCDQWYLAYNDEEWTKSVKDHVQNNFDCYNWRAKNSLLATIDWMGEWACSRTFGLGTKLPWDESWLIESLSDSTIYMAYYTVAHLIQGGHAYGDKPGPFGIKPEDLSGDEVWDYIFCLSEDVPQCNIKAEYLELMRKEFKFWYPLDLRCSGKDLIQNHLTMCLFNHAAIWKGKPEFWPRSFFANGHVMVDAEKMSKSKGNFLTVKQCVDQFTADATRLTCADAGDTLEDANFSRETANQTILRLFVFEEWVDEAFNKLELRTGDFSFLDSAFENELNNLIRKGRTAMEKMMFRDGVKFAWYDMQNLKDEYRNYTNGNMHKDLVRRFVEVQALVLAPICPHFCEHLWTKYLQGEGNVVKQLWPVPSKDEDLVMQRKYKILRDALADFRSQKDKAGGGGKKGKQTTPAEKPTHAVIYVAAAYKEWQQTVLSELQKVPLVENEDGSLQPEDKGFLKAFGQLDAIKGIPKEFGKKVMPFASFVVQTEVKARGRDALELSLPFDEASMLTEVVDVIKKQLDLQGVDIQSSDTAHEKDSTTMREAAQPAKPAIYFWADQAAAPKEEAKPKEGIAVSDFLGE